MEQLTKAPEGSIHPVELIEVEVAQLYKRTMSRADAEDRFLTTAEEYNLTALSVAVSLRRTADALRILVVVLAVGMIAAGVISLLTSR